MTPILASHRALCSGEHADIARLRPEAAKVIYRETALGLPLVYHLMQQRLLYLSPWVPGNVAAADRDLYWTARLEVYGQLSQAGAHAAR
jgi:hypothetical protein